MQYEPATKIFKIEIAEGVNLCQQASLSILSDMELLTPPEVTLTHFISSGGEVQKVSWTDSIVETSIATTVDPCAPYVYELWDVTSGPEVALDSDVFTEVDLTSATKTLCVQSSDALKAGLYQLRLYVYYASIQDNKVSKDFLIELKVKEESCI